MSRHSWRSYLTPQLNADLMFYEDQRKKAEREARSWLRKELEVQRIGKAEERRLAKDRKREEEPVQVSVEVS